MEKFTRLTAIACPLAIANLNTDQLIPARFLKLPRSAGLGSVLLRDLRFAAEGHQFDLRVEEESRGVRITGQVKPRPDVEMPELATARIGATILREAPVGEHGVFVLDRLPVRALELQFDLDDRRVRLPVDLGANS